VATLEKPTLRMQPHGEAIFVAGDGRRARRLGRAAIVASVLAALWIVGLGIGMLGFGSLPGVSLVKGSRAASPVAPVEGAPAAAARETARALLAVKTAAAAIEVSRTSNGQVAGTTRARKSVAAKKVSRGAATQPVPPPPVAAVNPAERTRGWARRDNQAPPGQVRKATATPPPPSHGRRVGQTPPAAPPPAPPGQVRKALDPPPPPPKKG
jgi:hypothetical protein